MYLLPFLVIFVFITIFGNSMGINVLIVVTLTWLKKTNYTKRLNFYFFKKGTNLAFTKE